MDDPLIPIAVFRPIVERWLEGFEAPEEAYRMLAANSDYGVDRWRFCLSENVKRGKNRRGETVIASRGWFTLDAIDWVDVDEFLTAIDATYLWRSELADYLPEDDSGWPDSEHEKWCAGCGKNVDLDAGDLGVRVEQGEMVNVRRRWSWWTLCALCATQLPKTKTSGTRRFTDDEILTYYRIYVTEGYSVTDIATKVYKQHGFTSLPGCETTIMQAWHRFGWPVRTRWQTKVLNRKLGRKMNHKVPIKDLRRLHVLHTRGKKLSIYELARRMHKRYGYTTPESMQRAVSDAWKVLGLKARDRIEMCQEMSTTNGLSPRDYKERARRRSEAGLNTKTLKPYQEICVGTTQRGKRCTHHSLPDSEYCWAHDPRFETQRNEQTRAMRAKNPLLDPAHLEPMAPLRAELAEFLEAAGTWKPLVETSGLKMNQLSKLKTDTVRQRIDRMKAARLRRAIRDAYELIDRRGEAMAV